MFFAPNIPIGEYVYNGYEIRLCADIRDIQNDMFLARIVGPNEILVQVPMVPFSQLHEAKEQSNHENEAGDFMTEMFVAREVERNKYIAKNGSLPQKANKKLYLLRIVDTSEAIDKPQKIPISNEVFSPKTLRGEIDYEIIPVAGKFKLDPSDPSSKEGQILSVTLKWRVTVKEDEPRKLVVDDSKESKGASKLAKAFGGMSVE